MGGGERFWEGVSSCLEKKGRERKVRGLIDTRRSDNFRGARYVSLPLTSAFPLYQELATYAMPRGPVLFGVGAPLVILSTIFVALRLVAPILRNVLCRKNR